MALKGTWLHQPKPWLVWADSLAALEGAACFPGHADGRRFMDDIEPVRYRQRTTLPEGSSGLSPPSRTLMYR